MLRRTFHRRAGHLAHGYACASKPSPHAASREDSITPAVHGAPSRLAPRRLRRGLAPARPPPRAVPCGASTILSTLMASPRRPLRALALAAPALGAAALAVAWAVTPVNAAPGASDSPTPDAPTPEPSAADSADDEALLEFHFSPVADLQIAIWLEDAEGNFIEDVFVTQATGKLGIANRPGLFEFVSSWRAPYGPRESVLPIWAHRRGKTYPKIIFHDANTSNHTSLGFHEGSSSAETYFCRPLTPSEDEAIVDTMTCPSPATFQSDKGEFSDQTSVYPPRNDLTSFEDDDDSPDAKEYAALNELDGVTRATPSAGPYLLGHRLRRGDIADGPLTAWIEVSLERDENEDWDFDREEDHWVDPKLPAYGREFLGQPAVVYKVEFDPAEPGYYPITAYEGYADLDGATGTIHPPDDTISTTEGSGADRLQAFDKFDASARFGVYSHGWTEPGEDSDTGGSCFDVDLPPLEALVVEATSFDEVEASFRVPELPEGVEITHLHAYYKTPEVAVLDPTQSTEISGVPTVCNGVDTRLCVDALPGEEISVSIPQLFGNYTYTVGVTYEDNCTNESPPAYMDVTTPVQPFQTIDGACFIATAAWGKGWGEELQALRWFRDEYMVGKPLAHDMVRMYYAYGPTLAKMIRDVPQARAMARLVLRPIARLARDAVEAGSEGQGEARPSPALEP
ncbi:hypothetical protein G6O69_34360 [Pseudenhygromyxa sp. WMMC2535]|uniref:CFI-box-CTERM domain-containing protein n=1 Tax=Pseudenhygromyxa sp. WMMC2535 TaxID=2712867 RepID=UPI00159599F6|nr:CFI-box-CTERM domain-containing protein [Pseudenhygromyxa sp. WMMC2535]NVB42956.1 hypothetical protein [Pseudenhygromyxa sp. WMMC2535]